MADRPSGPPGRGKAGTAEPPPGNPEAGLLGFAPFGGRTPAGATRVEEQPGVLGSQGAGAATRQVLAARFGGTP